MPYQFQVGQIDCTVILDGVDVLERDRFMRRFPEATEAEYRQAFADMGLSFDEASSSKNLLIAQGRDETVLVDTGMGGDLLAGMALAGIAPTDITLVVLTHTHGDHIIGLLDADGGPAFPQARYVISDTEMQWWQGRIDAGIVDQQAHVTMMEAHGLRQIAIDAEILPGLTAVPIPGHTPGQIALRFESDGQQLLHLADLLHSPMQLAHPEWSAKFDDDTSVSVPTRRALLTQAAESGVLTLFYHLDFPGLGYVRPVAPGFGWEPISS